MRLNFTLQLELILEDLQQIKDSNAQVLGNKTRVKVIKQSSSSI